jgi:hypothetical protein
MEYFQNDMLAYYAESGHHVHKIVFQYASDTAENKAALNFHLTQQEKLNILASVKSSINAKSFQQALEILK